MVEQRLARQSAYDAIDAVASAVRRSAYEPRRVRPPSSELLAFLDASQRLMAHLSSVRILLGRRRERLVGATVDEAVRATRTTLHDVLATERVEAPADAVGTPDPFELPAVPPGHDLVPWLVRRLHVTARDGREVGTHARAVLEALARIMR